MAAKVDPRLSAAILSSGIRDQVEASLVLKSDIDRDPKSFEELVARIVREAEERASTAAVSVAPYAQLGMLAIDAPARLIRELIRNPAIASASLIGRDQDAYIRPVRKKKVRLEDRPSEKGAGSANEPKERPPDSDDRTDKQKS